jgi:hypothetical protein
MTSREHRWKEKKGARTMRYSLWSRGRLLGYTDLDVHTVTPTMRQGFVEPTPEGMPLLEDATGVWRAMADRKRAQRARGGEEMPSDDALVVEAMNRREALDLELRDEHGELFECEFILIHDLFDMNAGIVDEMSDTEEEMEAAFEIHLSGLAPEDRAEALAERAACECEIEEFVAELQAQWKENALYGSAWPPPPPEDPRWEIMRYQLQAHLRRSSDDEIDLLEF